MIRRAVPLALGLMSVSNPQLNTMETLSKFSHDPDTDTAHNAVFSLGLVGAGARISLFFFSPLVANNCKLALIGQQIDP